MNKKLVFFMLVMLPINILFLSSCSIGGSRTAMLNKNNDEEKANARLEQLIETIKNQDKDALGAMFSKKAADEADNFDGEIEQLFGFIQGKIESWEKLDGLTVFESNDHGHKKKEVSSYYYVNTDKQKYFFLLRDYPIDTGNPDNVGFYLLLVVKAEDEKDIYDDDKKILYDDGNKKIPHVGIYLPIK